MKKEYCGLFGIDSHPQASKMTYFGLYALQHRGQESSGICSWDGNKLKEHRGMGLTADVFNEEHFEKHLQGNVAIGHVRYATTGASLLRNAQPFMVHYKEWDMAIAHNGNLTNTKELHRELEEQGVIFQTTMDSEIIMQLIARNMQNKTVEEAVVEACKRIEGAFSLLLLCNNKLIALRDPWGFRPLVLGQMDKSYVFASETCAFDLLEAKYLRSLQPGEMVVVENGKISSTQALPPQKKSSCIFELVYFARPDSLVFEQEVYGARKKMGKILADEMPVDADFVMPFPDSGIYAALGYSQQSGLPFEMAMIRNHYVGRTFIQPTQDRREFSVRVKLNPVSGMVKGKRIVIVEDSIVRGTTIKARVKQLRELGAKELHMRVSCPPVAYPCFYGIDFSSKGELIAASKSVEEIAKFIGLDSLHFLSLDGLLNAVKPQGYCLACFDGKYPILSKK